MGSPCMSDKLYLVEEQKYNTMLPLYLTVLALTRFHRSWERLEPLPPVKKQKYAMNTVAFWYFALK